MAPTRPSQLIMRNGLVHLFSCSLPFLAFLLALTSLEGYVVSFPKLPPGATLVGFLHIHGLDGELHLLVVLFVRLRVEQRPRNNLLILCLWFVL